MTTPHHPVDDRVARLLTLDTEPYLSCEECFDRMDGYVEALLQDPEHDDQRMRTHLAGCPACNEEAQSLLQLVAEDRRR